LLVDLRKETGLTATARPFGGREMKEKKMYKKQQQQQQTGWASQGQKQ